MPAFVTDKRRERVAVKPDQCAAGEPRCPAGNVEKVIENHHRWLAFRGARAAASPKSITTIGAESDRQRLWIPDNRFAISGMTNHSAAAFAPRLASIWPMASTTASKVSSVEAWRAL
jgi:hypothetical protein